MKIEAVELTYLSLPLVTPFRTSFGVAHSKETFLLRVVTDGAEGWAECGAEPDPLYSSEFLGAAELVVRDHLLPRITAVGEALTAATAEEALAPVKGHRMAKHVLLTAVLDAELTAAGTSFARHLGATRSRVPTGVSVGMTPTVAELLDRVGGYLEEGYARIKLKVQPGWDLEPLAAVRRTFGDELMLTADANTAYRRHDLPHLRRFDAFGLALLEQPLPEDDLLGHVAVARALTTPICLDESILSARDAATAIALGACGVINVKPARVGGYAEARRVHDVARAHGVPVWCGGMLECGVGRAANLALTALPGFTIPGDVSASSRYFTEDVTAPIELTDGLMSVPTGPGIGVEVDRAAVRRFATSTTTLAV